ncbi:hypothetical protein [Achromobacter phage Motura]|uniref:Uncharacterized protein n=1 Tax=Achromobacter phage Motura TaxID=2591403 RepID=A0A514CT06_9CAUD|nr:hypothetical protein H1O15_gp198 [Achromobacter phage Motura]QDH83590.1 hypothetical protein [Achromobacter phage Motura]
MYTVNITDRVMETPTLAKVIVTTTGNPTKSQIHASICEQLQYLGAPVENSFRKVKQGVYAGFVRANREVRVIEKQELTAKYRLLSSAANIVMDKADESLWEVKSGSGGSYLARHGNENLSELIDNRVEASAEFGRGYTPKVNQLTIGQGRRGEVAAFVTPSGDMDYGFIIRTAPDKCKVVSHTTKTEVVVPNRMVAGFYPVEIPREVHHKIMASFPVKASTKASEADYWKRAFAYAPEYADEIVDFIAEGSDA